MARTLASRSAKAQFTRPSRKPTGTSRTGQARRRAAVAVEGKMARASSKVRGGRSPRRTKAERELAQRMLAALRAGQDLRVRKVRRLKAAIKVRAYENDLKFEVALERMRSLIDGGISLEPLTTVSLDAATSNRKPAHIPHPRIAPR